METCLPLGRITLLYGQSLPVLVARCERIRRLAGEFCCRTPNRETQGHSRASANRCPNEPPDSEYDQVRTKKKCWQFRRTRGHQTRTLAGYKARPVDMAKRSGS